MGGSDVTDMPESEADAEVEEFGPDFQLADMLTVEYWRKRGFDADSAIKAVEILRQEIGDEADRVGELSPAEQSEIFARVRWFEV